MKSIYACKLYKNSTRKSKIQAALQNPVNAELVQQLASYLDEEYIHPVDKDKHDTQVQSKQSHKNTEHSYSSSRRASNDVSHVPLPHVDDEDTIDDKLSEDSDDINTESNSSDSELEGDEVAENTSINSQSITASTEIPDNVPEELKGMLNLKDTTCGVNRIRVKDNELWIHYNDNINLNNVMTDVVELIESAGYDYLQFNRLARSENAVVFEINTSDTGVASDNNAKEGD